MGLCDSTVPNSSIQTFLHEPLVSISSSQQKCENYFHQKEVCLDDEFRKSALQQLEKKSNKSEQTQNNINSKQEKIAKKQLALFKQKRNSENVILLKSNDLINEKNICNDSLHTSSSSFNIKISSIVVKLVQKNILNKLLKLQLHGASTPYYTEPIKSLELLDWRDKGYYFLKVSEWSILNIEMLEEKNETMNIVGKCKVYLINLIDNYRKGASQHTNFFKNNSQEIVAHTIIEYEFFQRNSPGLNSLSSLSCSDKNKQIQLPSQQFQRNLSSLSKDENKRKSFNFINKNKFSMANSSRNDQDINISKRQKRNFSMVERKQVCNDSSAPHNNRNRKGTAAKAFISKEKRFRTMKNELFYHPSFSETRIHNLPQNQKVVI